MRKFILIFSMLVLLNSVYAAIDTQGNNETLFLGGLGLALVLIIIVVLGFFIYFFMRKKKAEF
ncbi:MAG: hypothetical protein V1672_05515 [Candidatus Diapherotrites archaeon]